MRTLTRPARSSPSHPTPARGAENLLRAHEELSAIHGADETLSQRAKEESQRLEELRRELQRLTAIQATLPPEEQQLSRQLEQQRLLLQERERGACSGLGPAPAPAPPGTPPRAPIRPPRACRPGCACGSRAAFQQNNLQNEQKLSELQKGGSMYKKWLGLEFERVEGAPPPPLTHPTPHP